MNKYKFLIPVLLGLGVGQLFAESERPLKVVNRINVGYSDNIYHTADGKGGSFVTDVVDLSFRAAFSDRTDFTLKSQVTVLNDDGGMDLYPNLYAMLNHSVSPRLLLSFSEYFRSGDKSGTDTKAVDKNARYNYFNNRVGASADYVLTRKDRLIGSVSYDMLRHDKEIETLDRTTVEGGLTWSRELSPQRTFSTLNLRQRRTTYDNMIVDDPGVREYLNDDAYVDETEMSAGLTHTFNQQWQGNVEAGATYSQPNFPDANVTIIPAPTVLEEAANEATLSPLFRAGMVFSPSPRTRLSGNFSLSKQASDGDGYGGQNTTELSFVAQHDLTAKLMAKAVLRFANTTYDAQEQVTANKANRTERTEDRMDLEFMLTYKLNRMNFIEMSVLHREKDSDEDDDSSWAENRASIGWRLELN
jgi:hypothetical protein